MQGGLCLALALAASVAQLASAQTPVKKVLEMLQSMKAKGTTDMETEANVFEDYSKFVRRRSLDLDLEIKSTKAEIEELMAVITKAENVIKEKSAKIAEIDAQTEEMEASQKAATALRETEHSKFTEVQTSYAESLYALDRAIQILAAQNYDRSQAMALLQKAAKSVRGMRHVLMMLELQQRTMQPGNSGAPAVAGYEFQSGGVLDLLEKLKDRFRAELAELQKEEMNSAHAYELEMIHVGDMIASLKSNREEAVALKAKAEATLAAAKGNLADAQASLAEAQEFLQDLTATFGVKTATFNANQKVRTEELATLGEAINIISEPTVSSSYAEHINALAQVPAGKQAVSFLQLSSRREAKKTEAATYLRNKAKALRSEVLAQAAAQLAANPFAKVIDMIKSLLERLQAEAASEAEHKAYCDEELKLNKEKRKKFSAKASRLTAEIDEKTMEIAEMQKDIETLAAQEAALAEAIKEATAKRQEEKPINEKAIADAKEGQVALKQAIVVLKEFYAKQLEESFVQLSGTGQKQVPEMAEYKGMQRLKGGVVGMLEVIESDFARLEADTTAAENAAVSEYMKFMTDAEADKELKHKAWFKMGLKKDQGEFDKEMLQKDLDNTLEQLKMANLYYEELKPQCVTVNVNWDDRVAQRKEELEALNKAYEILDAKVPGE